MNAINQSAAPAPVPSGRKICVGCGTSNLPTSVYCQKCGLELPQATVTGPVVQPAGFWIRLAAHIVDQIILFLVLQIVLFMKVGQESAWLFNPGPGWQTIDLLWNMAVPLAIETIYFTVAIGIWARTIGKALVRVKVVRADGSRVSAARALGRYVAYLLNWLTFGLSFLVIAFSREKRGLHDRIADTRVTRA